MHWIELQCFFFKCNDNLGCWTQYSYNQYRQTFLLHDHVLNNYECSPMVICGNGLECQHTGLLHTIEINWLWPQPLKLMSSNHTDSMDMSLSKLQETGKDREVWPAEVHGVTKSQTWLSDWIATKSLTSSEPVITLHLTRLIMILNAWVAYTV